MPGEDLEPLPLSVFDDALAVCARDAEEMKKARRDAERRRAWGGHG